MNNTAQFGSRRSGTLQILQDILLPLVQRPIAERRLSRLAETPCTNSANGMVRPCPCPANKRSWQGGAKDKGARHVSDIQYRDRRDRHRYRQELVPRRGPRCARRHRARQKWSRGQVEARLANVPPCLIGMEACVGAHHLSRNLASLGHDARLMPAKYVRAFSKGQKNDFNDAEAIAEAVQRPTMKFVATKTAEQLDLQALHRVRERLVSQRTGVTNQIRAFMLERGIAVRQGIG